MTQAGPTWHNKYGLEYLEVLVASADWRSVEVLWRWGAGDLPAVASAIATSGNGQLVNLLGFEIAAARFSDRLPGLPDLLLEHELVVSEHVALQIFDRLLDVETPLAPAYLPKAHILFAWLMRQTPARIDDVALAIALRDHPQATNPEVSAGAIDRIGRTSELSTRLVDELSRQSEHWSTGTSWNHAAELVGRTNARAKGRAEIVRALTWSLLQLPATEAASPTRHFVVMMERHAARVLVAAFDGPSLPNSNGVASAIHAVVRFKQQSIRDDLFGSLAAHQLDLWSAHRSTIQATWATDDWLRMLKRWCSPSSKLGDASGVLADVPLELDYVVVRVALAQGETAGDATAKAASAALRRFTLSMGEEPESRVEAAFEAAPWDIVATDYDAQYLGWILKDSLSSEVCGAVVRRAFEGDALSPHHAAEMIPDDRFDEILSVLTPGTRRAGLATALYEDCSADFVRPIMAKFAASYDDGFDVIDVIAARDQRTAFESFDLARWHGLDASARDQLISLLQRFGTLDETSLLDMIAADSDGSNSERRAKAASRWAELAPLHGDIPTGVFSLLDSARPDLNHTFAEVAEAVQPRDESTLLRLRQKWLSSGKIGEAARSALDTVAAGIVSGLGSLNGPRRRAEGPNLLRLLGVSGSHGSFDCLVSHVGAHAIDDDLALRRAAASALRTYVDATSLNERELGALGTVAATEPDSEASDHLREALAAASMGEDAAILVLFDLAGIDYSAVNGTPDLLFGDQKSRILASLKRLVVQRELGQPGWAGYVEQMDLVAEGMVRAAYLQFGDSEGLKNDIRGNSSKPDYGSLVKAFAKAKGFDGTSAHLQALHDMRSTRTNAHHSSGGDLDADAVGGALNSLETAAREIITRLQNNGPLLRAVPSAGAGS
jgi:hypothetical protein